MAFVDSIEPRQHRMSIAFLSGRLVKPQLVGTGFLSNCDASAAVSIPDFLEAVPSMPNHRSVHYPSAPTSHQSSPLRNSPDADGLYSASRLDSLDSNIVFDSLMATKYADIRIDGNVPHLGGIKSSGHNINSSPVEQNGNLKAVGCATCAVSPTIPRYSFEPRGAFHAIDTSLSARARAQQVRQHNHECQHLCQSQTKLSVRFAKGSPGASRDARPSYGEEQKFFVMYIRVVKGLPWPKIEKAFSTLFGLRTQDGLTSVYYRIRMNWKMKEVKKTDLKAVSSDKNVVKRKATHFSTEFLTEVGYCD
jgi:hypothetical protein